MSTTTLYHYPPSPWSEMARWALDHHEIRHRRRVHRAMVDEVPLRVRLRRPGGPVSVPALVAGDVRLGDSFDIACWADSVGSSAPLVPPARRAEIANWKARADELLDAARANFVRQFLADRDALVAMADMPWLPAAVAAPLAATALRFVLRKYRVADDLEAQRSRMRAELLALRESIGRGQYLVGGELSFADVAMVAALQGVAPVDHPSYPIPSAMRPGFVERRLSEEFADVLAWRDRIYRDHRPSA